VQAVINLLHSNAWLTTQEFSAPDPGHAAMLVHMVASQTAPAVQVVDSAGTVRFSTGAPLGPEGTVLFRGYNSSGINLLTLYDGGLFLVSGDTGQPLNLTAADPAHLECQRLWVMPNGQQTYLAGKVQVGRPLSSGHPNVLNCEFSVDMTGNASDPAICVIGDVGFGPTTVFQVTGEGIAEFEGALEINGVLTDRPQACYVRADTGQVGLLVGGVGTEPVTVDLFQCFAHTVGTLFAVGPAGQIKTNQTSPGAVSGQENALLPIYDTNGVLIGYIPIYPAKL
jgi:hypothetical protein